MVVITFSGLAAAGKSTVAKIVADKLGLKYISVGQIFRDLAKEQGMDVKEFVEKVDKNIHKKIDEKTRELSRKGNIVIDGRVAAFFAENAFKVFITAELHERARRIHEREGIDIKEAIKYIEQRDEEDRKRYLDIYGIDIQDIKAYNLVLDTTRYKPEEAAEIIILAVKKYFGDQNVG